MAPRPAWRHQSLDFAACETCHQLVEAGGRQVVAEPSSGPRLCDFCSAPRLAAWRYPSLDFVACDACNRLIEAGDRKALAERTYATAPVPPDLKANPGSRKAVMAVILALHDKFFERAAPARPVRMLQPIPIRPLHTSSPRRGVRSTTAVDLASYEGLRT
jgi:hypothetical protein